MKHLFLFVILSFNILLFAFPLNTYGQEAPKNIILFIGDGWGKNQIEATNFYHHGELEAQPYQEFERQYYLSTYPGMDGKVWQNENIHKYNTGYSSDSAWNSPAFLRRHTTGSAASGTAIATGYKTALNAIGIGYDSTELFSIIDRANELDKPTGLVTSVPISHATPASFAAHNIDRYNYAEIANEMIIDSKLNVLMGCGHPYYTDNGEHSDTLVWSPDQEYLGGLGTWNNLLSGDIAFDSTTVSGNNIVQDIDNDSYPDPWTLIHDSAEFISLASGPTPKRVLGIPKTATTLQQERSYPVNIDSAGPYEIPFNSNIPKLKDMTRAALNVLDGNENGYFLMVEGGAIDWAGHNNQMDRLIEEQHDFNESVEAAIAWVEEQSSWEETLIIVTGDHECGFLTGPDYPGDDPVDNFSVVSNGPNELPDHKWNDWRHTNQLVPFFANGVGSAVFEPYADEEDFVRGRYLNNSEVGSALFDLWPENNSPVADPKNVIILTGNGMGYNHVRAAGFYQGTNAQYKSWPFQSSMSTWPAMTGPIWEQDILEKYNGWYNSKKAWTNWQFSLNNATESAAAATAMFTGRKTAANALGLTIDSIGIKTIAERAFEIGKSAGIVTSVPISSPTAAAVATHNPDKTNYAQIANEMIIDSRLSVIMGCGHPHFDDNGNYSSSPVWEQGKEYLGGMGTWNNLMEGQITFDSTTINGNNQLKDVDGDDLADPWTMIHDSAEFVDLQDGPTPVRVMGVPKVATTLQQNRNDSKNSKSELPFTDPLNTNIPRLPDMTKAALNVLDNNENGLFLLVNGGAIAWASTEHQKGRLIEEQADFNSAVEAIENWVEENSSWDETLAIVAGTHETGYLVGPDFNLNGNFTGSYAIKDKGAGSLPEMQFLHDGNTNHLVPFYGKGTGIHTFNTYTDEIDFVRKKYLNNTELAQVIFKMWKQKPFASPDIDEGQLVESELQKKNREIRIFPNPAEKHIFIELPAAAGEMVMLTVLDAKGQSVYHKQQAFGKFTLDVQNWKSGFYLLRIIKEDGVKSFKLLIE